MAANGFIPSSMLGPVPGSNAGLLREAALAYTAMHAASPVSLALFDGSVGRCYRSFARQQLARAQWCAAGKCGNAAVPGTSNHGLGIAVDLMTFAQRSAIDRVGARFGWSKSWSDAQHEWWHIRYQSGHWKPRPDPTRILAPHQRRAVSTLLHRRRMREAERASGKGPKFRKWDRLVERSYRKVEKQWRRADRADRKRVLRLALDDRNGRI